MASTGYYNAFEPFPSHRNRDHHAQGSDLSFHLHRASADEPSTLRGFERSLHSLLQQQFPEIVDFWLPPEVAPTHRDRQYTEAYPGTQARDAACGPICANSCTQMGDVVDDDIDARDWKDVMWAMATRMTRRATSRDRRHADRLSRFRARSGLARNRIGRHNNGPRSEAGWGTPIA